MPKIASTTAPDPARREPRSPSACSASTRSRLAAASPLSSAAGQSRSVSTSKPVAASRRAATSPSPALLPLPQTTRTGPSGRQPGDRLGDGAAGGLHQLERGHAPLLDRPAVDRAHLLGVVERAEPGLHLRKCRRSATAAAVSREWVREILTVSPRAASAARPMRRTSGGSPATTSISRRPKPSLDPERLHHRLLRGKPGREVAPRAGAGGSVLQLLLGEDPLGQARMALQRALEAVDLEQVDADAGGHAAAATSSG